MNAFEQYKNRIALIAITGSRAYGLANENSDTDKRGFFVAPNYDLPGFCVTDEVPEQIEAPEGDEVYWEVGKFVKLACQNNPNVLEALYSPAHMQHFAKNSYGSRALILLGNRKKFLCKRIEKTYGGYATSQLGRGMDELKKGNERQGWKHLMHLVRLLISGSYALKYGEILVNIGDHRDQLLKIRHGEMSLDELLKIHHYWEEQFSSAKEQSILPELPDTSWVNVWLSELRSIKSI